MKRVTVYINEAGTLPDPKDKVIVVAAVVPKSKEQIDMSLTKMKKKRDVKRKSATILALLVV